MSTASGGTHPAAARLSVNGFPSRIFESAGSVERSSSLFEI